MRDPVLYGPILSSPTPEVASGSAEWGHLEAWLATPALTGEGATDAEKIEIYIRVLVAADIKTRPKETKADPYRKAMRDLVVDEFLGDLDGLNEHVLMNPDLRLPTAYNRVPAQIFEDWCKTMGIMRGPGPVFTGYSQLHKSKRSADGTTERGKVMTECKALSRPRGPSAEEKKQMEDYATILKDGLKGAVNDGTKPPVRAFEALVYFINSAAAITEWEKYKKAVFPRTNITFKVQ